MSNNKFHKRAGTTDQGKDYENLLVAYYSLKLTLNEDVTEFKISSNDDKYGNFDDLVIEIVWKNGQVEQYNIQAKHKQTNKNKYLVVEALTADKGKFSIKKRFEEFSENEEKNHVKLILFTNRVMALSNDIELMQDFFYSVYITRHSVKSETLNTSKQNNIYKFYIKVHPNTEMDKLKMEEVERYRRFFANFYLYTNQKNVNDIRDAIMKMLLDTFKCDENVVKNFLDFVITWSNRDGNKDKLTKEFLKLKMTECLLSPYIMGLSEDEETERSKLFQEAVNAFDVTVISDSNKTGNFYRAAYSNTSLELINTTGLKYQLISRSVKSFKELSLQNRAILLWLTNECPLIVKVTRSNEDLVYRTINVCRLDDKKKKFVLIGTQRLLPNYKTFYTLLDLYNERQDLYNEITTKFICSFQGQKETCLENLMQNDEKIKSIVTTNELIAMIEGVCNYGCPKEYLPDYYIERRLTKITIDFDFIDKFGDANVIVISCNGKFSIIKSHLPGTNFIIIEDVSDLSNSPTESSIEFFDKNNVYVAYTKCPPETYAKICETHPYTPCHFFQVDQNGNLEWLESSGSIENLKSFQTNVSHFIKDKNVFDTYQLNLICANPGMGKSIMMSHVKNNYSSQFWVIKVFVREHTNFFEESTDHQFFLDYILNKTSLTDFERRIVDILTDKRKLVLMWDGIDEIGKSAFENVLEVIESLRKMGFVQWVTARSNLKQTLEDRFNIFARTIKPFGKKDQETYMTKRLQPKIKDFEKVSEEIMRKVDNDYLEVPLQIFMLTELFLHNDTICRSLMTGLTITDTFEYFIEEKFNFYYKKANIDVSNNIAKQILNEHKNQRLEYYEILALNLCLDPKLLVVLNLNNIEDFLTKIKEENDCFGILEVINNNPNFVHRTYAEYFVAVWLSKNYTKIKDLETIFFDERFRNIRFMFDLIMAKGCPVHVAVLYKNLDGVDGNIDKINLQDRAGRNPLHIASSWGTPHPLLNTRHDGNKFIIETEKSTLVENEETSYMQIMDRLVVSQCDVNQKDKLFQFDCFQYADRSLSLASLDAIAEYNTVDYNELKNFGDLPTVLFYIAKFNYLNLLKIVDDIPYVETNQSCSLFHIAAGFNRSILVTKLLQNRKYRDNINKRDKKNWAPVHYAACFGHVRMIQTLKDMGSDIHLGTKDGKETPLYVAAMSGQTEVVKYLIDNEADVNVSRSNGWTPLHTATQKQNLSVIKVLYDNNANVNTTNQDGYSPLYVAARKGNLEILKYLISKDGDVNLCGENGESPLYIAAKLGHFNVVKCLIQNGADVNAVKNIGWTPLMTAIRHGHFHIVKVLLESNAICDATTDSFFKKMKLNRLSTCPLDIASERGYLDIAKLLFQKGARSSQTCLHKASAAGHLDMVKLLIANGAKIHVSDIEVAAKKGFHSIANYLLEKMTGLDDTDRRNLRLRINSKSLARTKSQQRIMSTPSMTLHHSKRRKWTIIIFLIFIMAAVVLGGSSILNYLFDTKLN